MIPTELVLKRQGTPKRMLRESPLLQAGCTWPLGRSMQLPKQQAPLGEITHGVWTAGV